MNDRYAWKPPETVAVWPCRFCKVDVNVPAEGVQAKATFDAELERRGEPPLDPATIMICESCRDKRWMSAGDRNQSHTAAVAALIRELRGGTTHPAPPGPPPSPAREVEIVRNLRLMNHPDVDGMVTAIREARGRTAGSKPGPSKT